MDSPNNKIFSRSRIANVLAAIVILTTLFVWVHILLDELDGTAIILGEDNGSLVLTIVGILSTMSGFALRHLFGGCDGD